MKTYYKGNYECRNRDNNGEVKWRKAYILTISLKSKEMGHCPLISIQITVHLPPVIVCRGFLLHVSGTFHNFINKNLWSKADGVYPYLPPFPALKKTKYGEHPKNITVCFCTLYYLILSFCLLNCYGLFKC